MFMHATRFDRSLALLRAGKSNDARIAMIAITTKSSINVNPRGNLRMLTEIVSSLFITTRDDADCCVGVTAMVCVFVRTRFSGFPYECGVDFGVTETS